jgi:hypothetical protein
MKSVLVVNSGASLQGIGAVRCDLNHMSCECTIDGVEAYGGERDGAEPVDGGDWSGAPAGWSGGGKGWCGMSFVRFGGQPDRALAALVIPNAVRDLRLFLFTVLAAAYHR